jgi:two-component system, cell cycle sensor histidine kinase and response regulator CckA
VSDSSSNVHPDDSYSELFEAAPVAIWHEDFSDVKKFLDDLRASGNRDIATYFLARPEAVRECVQRVRVLEVNRLARDFYGAGTQEQLVKVLPDLFDDAALEIFREEVVALARGETSFEAEVTARTLKGDERVVQMNVSLLPTPRRPWSRVIVAFTDLTERKRLERELLQAQKLESLGRFAGGVAHDLNNALTIINGYSEMLLGDIAPEHPCAAGLLEIKKAGERAARLTQQLLAFSRKQVLQLKVVNLNTIVADARNVFKTAAGEHITLSTVLAPDLAATRVDPAQFYHVLLNLVLNARDAMPHGGDLEIRTANVKLGGASAARLALKSGSYTVVTVTDTGIGMDQETQQRVFDPFFTTKDVGKGTGLGLSSAFGVIKQSGGSMIVASELACGSRFSIYLPATSQVQDVTTEEPHPVPAGGSETILVVEDQPSVRAFLSDALRKYGYQILEAADSTEALRCFGQHSSSIHLIVTDIVMPGMTGPELVQRMMLEAPSLRVVLVWGV